MDYLQAGSNDLLAGLQRFQSVLADLQVSHERLEKHAERMEAELEVSNRQLAEKVEELDHTNQYLEAILESLPSAVIVRDAQGKITRVNPACQALLEAPAAEWIGCDQELEIRPSADAAGLATTWVRSRSSPIKPS